MYELSLQYRAYICPNLVALPYNITLSTGEMHVTLPNGDTQVYNLDESCSAKVGFSQRPTHAQTNPPVPGEMSVVLVKDYFVLVRFADLSEYRIWMGIVDNQATWMNTQAGANACVTAIQANFN